MSLNLLHVTTTNNGALDVLVSVVRRKDESRPTVLVEDPSQGFRVGSSNAEQRRELALALRQIETTVATDSFLINQPGRDRRNLRVESARRALWAWDFDNIVLPLEGLVGAGVQTILFQGLSETTGVERLDLRGAAREGYRRAFLSAQRLRELVFVATWTHGSEAFERQVIKLVVRGLSQVVPGKATLMLGPDAPNSLLRAVATRPASEASEVLASMPREIEVMAYLAGLRYSVVQEANALGLTVIEDAQSHDFARLVGTAAPGQTLFVMAHQERDMLFLGDGQMYVPSLWRKRPSVDWACYYDAVDLAVCDANREGGLAELFTVIGATVVLPRWSVGNQGRFLARLRTILGLLRSGYTMSLPELHTAAWLHEMARHDDRRT